jgi:hypothetical protein
MSNSEVALPEGLATLGEVSDLLSEGEIEKSVDAGPNILHIVNFQGNRYAVLSSAFGPGIITKL